MHVVMSWEVGPKCWLSWGVSQWQAADVLCVCVVVSHSDWAMLLGCGMYTDSCTHPFVNVSYNSCNNGSVTAVTMEVYSRQIM